MITPYIPMFSIAWIPPSPSLNAHIIYYSSFTKNFFCFTLYLHWLNSIPSFVWFERPSALQILDNDIDFDDKKLFNQFSLS